MLQERVNGENKQNVATVVEDMHHFSIWMTAVHYPLTQHLDAIGTVLLGNVAMLAMKRPRTHVTSDQTLDTDALSGLCVDIIVCRMCEMSAYVFGCDTWLPSPTLRWNVYT